MPRRSRLRLPALFLATALATLVAVSAQAEVAQMDGLIVSFDGSIDPQALPRTGKAAVGVSVEGRVRTTDDQVPPSLRRISLEINRNGKLDGRGLPVCRPTQLRASSTATALETCGAARVGGGHVSGQIVLPEQRPFVFTGKVVAFNGRLEDGRGAILAHLYSPQPVPLTFVLVFAVERIPGVYGTRLVAVVSKQTRQLTHVTSFKLHLRRTFTVGGERRSYLSAGCPAPEGFPGATFPLARASYSFDNGTTLSSVLVRTCHART